MLFLNVNKVIFQPQRKYVAAAMKANKAVKVKGSITKGQQSMCPDPAPARS